ncbi:MAG: ABC transporter permease [Phycisphaerae bacterium]|nr:ABC transporter permease [Phycisphaerae bacterium]
MDKKRHKGKGTPHPPPLPGKREFSFSRVAGVSPTEYAAVSSSAVFAVIASAFGLVSLFGWGWWLIASAAGMFLALLSLYYIATSAGTLTGRKIALTAILISAVGVGLGGGRQLLDYRRERNDIARVRTLAEWACERVRAGQYESIHEQLSPDFRENMPLGYWRYEWRRFFEANGQPRRIELAPTVFPVPTGEIVANVKVYFEDRSVRDAAGHFGERAASIRLVYAQVKRRVLDEDTRRLIDAAGSKPDDWQLISVPSFISPLPPPYREPIVWPAPGRVERLTTRPDGNLEAEQVWPTYPPPVKDSKGRLIVAEEPLPPLVPPDGVYSQWFYEPWLPQPAPPKPTGHERHHH